MQSGKSDHKLDVYLNHILVGTLVERGTGAMEFTYDQIWLSAAGHVPISQSLPLTSANFKGDKVRSFFENLLPDSIEVRRKMAACIGSESTSDFDFARVEEVMKLLDWKWGLPDGTYRVPTQDEMKDTVRSLFQSAVDRMFDFNKTYTWCRTGGFCVSIFKDNTKDFNQHTIRISFEVESETIYPD